MCFWHAKTNISLFPLQRESSDKNNNKLFISAMKMTKRYYENLEEGKIDNADKEKRNSAVGRR